MKRCMLVLTVLLATTLAWLNAQEHMMFMKTPIDGTISEFATKMRAKGFVQKEVVDKDIIMMSGKFMGKNCEIWIVGTEKTKTVWKIVVYFDLKYTSWYTIKGDYMDVINAYTEKYGTPSDSYHLFVRPYYEGDGYEMQAIKLDKCGYASFWSDIESGNIMVSIEKGAQIRIAYEDRLNKEKRDIEKKSQINDDI